MRPWLPDSGGTDRFPGLAVIVMVVMNVVVFVFVVVEAVVALSGSVAAMDKRQTLFSNDKVDTKPL